MVTLLRISAHIKEGYQHFSEVSTVLFYRASVGVLTHHNTILASSCLREREAGQYMSHTRHTHLLVNARVH